MSTTNRIAAHRMETGDVSSVILFPPEETITLQVQAAVPFAAPAGTTPQVLLTVREYNLVDMLRYATSAEVRAEFERYRGLVEARGSTMSSCRLSGAGAARILTTKYTSGMVLIADIHCLSGPAVVQLDEITGIPAVSGVALLDVATELDNLAVTTAALAAGGVTLPKTSTFGTIKCLAFVGNAGPGACAAVGTAVGDRAIMYFGADTVDGSGLAAYPVTDFEPAITVINQVQQASTADLSGETIIVLLAPAAA